MSSRQLLRETKRLWLVMHLLRSIGGLLVTTGTAL
jgi:hypothetical protein